jgi:hypothetical protein
VAKVVRAGGYDPVMLVHQSFRYELAPTAAQRAALIRHAGAARWAWNWGLAVRRKAWQRRGETLGAIELHRLLNRLKRTTRTGGSTRYPSALPRRPYVISTVPTLTTGGDSSMAVGSAGHGSRRRAAAPTASG